MRRQAGWLGWIRSFPQFTVAQAAVSPVISTILMVAITVVLAATAFVLVADVGKDSAQPGMQVGLTADEESDFLEVTSAGEDADWRRVTLVVDDKGSGPVYVGNLAGIINEPADANGFALTQRHNDLMSASQAMVGGDLLFFCRDGGAGGPFEVAIKDEDANLVIGSTFKFAELGDCTP